MQIKLAALVVMSTLCGLPAAHAAETSNGPDTMAPLPLHATDPNASLVTSVSSPPSSHAGSLGRNPAPDCDGPIPSTSPVTVLLSRLARSSTVAQGKHCSMPPGPETSPYIEELHP